MDDAPYKIEFFGWCSEGEHDKVWGWVSIGGDAVLYNFWGKRGAKLTFKRYQGKWGSQRLLRLSEQKTRPDRTNGTYAVVPISEIETALPGFHEEFMHQLALAKLFDDFHGEARHAAA